ncbi:H-NS histone family protein [Tardiphaga alba]|nr:H-NS histone family protein [Tardiphaga alba]
MYTPDLKSLSVPQLLALREDIDKQLLAHRDELQAQLAQIGTVNGRGGPTRGVKIAPKYRHPKTGETWTGRGGVAGWLAKEIAAGRNREEFLIDNAAKGSRSRTK